MYHRHCLRKFWKLFLEVFGSEFRYFVNVIVSQRQFLDKIELYTSQFLCFMSEFGVAAGIL